MHEAKPGPISQKNLFDSKYKKEEWHGATDFLYQVRE